MTMRPSVQTLAALALDVYNRGEHQGYTYESTVDTIDAVKLGSE
jgi:hypothetical protein